MRGTPMRDTPTGVKQHHVGGYDAKSPALVQGGTIAVGNKPTSVAIDDLSNIALVTNNGGNTLSVVNLSTKSVATVSTNILTAPVAVGVNPETGMALVATRPRISARSLT